MSVFAARYARAFAAVAEASHLDTVLARQQLRDFAETLAGSHDLRETLMNPSLPADGKLRVVDAIAARLGMAKPVRNFIAVIMGHQRLAELGEILSDYAVLADEQGGITQAQIISARSLNEEDRQQLEAEAARIAGGKVQTTYSEDASLLGGAVIRIGSTVYDGSIQAQLNELRHRLANA